MEVYCKLCVWLRSFSFDVKVSCRYSVFLLQPKGAELTDRSVSLCMTVWVISHWPGYLSVGALGNPPPQPDRDPAVMSAYGR